MCSQHQGHDALLAFNEDLGDALAKACELDKDLDGVHLAHAAQIVRRQGVQQVSCRMPTGLRATNAARLGQYDLTGSQYQAPE